jgi:NADH:ubiquinone oxidoreductase subunit 6 (subunit J)
MAEVVFFLAAIGAIAGAVGTIALRNPFYAVLALVCHLLALAALFLLLRAEFVAAAQVVVYAGAVMVLYVFVVAYIGGSGEPLGGPGGSGLRVASALFAGALFVELSLAVLGSGLTALEGEGAGYRPDPNGFGTPGQIGELFLTKFLVAFEVASLLLLIAAVGAVILARRRSGLDDPQEISVGDLVRRPGVSAVDAPPETMLEAGGPPGR